MFYDRSASFVIYTPDNLEDFIRNSLFEDFYTDDEYKEYIDGYRNQLLVCYQLNGEDATIKLLNEHEEVSCHKLKVF